MRPHVIELLFSEFVLTLPHPFSTVAPTSQLFSILTTFLSCCSHFFHFFPPQLTSFHLFPTLLNSSQRISPLPISSQLFSTRLGFSHLLPPLLNSSHVFSPLLNSSHLFSAHLMISPRVNSSQVFSPQSLQTGVSGTLHKGSQCIDR